MVEVVERMLFRRIAPRGRTPFPPHNIACLDPHVAAGDTLRRELQARQIPVGRMLIATPEVSQGLERPLVVATYPIHGPTPSAFELDPGRLCVSLTRHLFACLVVARDGFEGTLTGHQHDSGSRPLGSPDQVWRGMQGHRRLWQELRELGRIVPV